METKRTSTKSKGREFRVQAVKRAARKKARPARCKSIYAMMLGRDEAPRVMVKQIREGFPVAVIDRLQEALDTTQAELLGIAHISPSTLTRRRAQAHVTGRKKVGKKAIKATARLSPEESGRLYRIASVTEDAMRLFDGDREAALRWLKRPAKALGGVTPMSCLDNEAGADAVRDLIGRIEYGVVT